MKCSWYSRPPAPVVWPVMMRWTSALSGTRTQFTQVTSVRKYSRLQPRVAQSRKTLGRSPFTPPVCCAARAPVAHANAASARNAAQPRTPGAWTRWAVAVRVSTVAARPPSAAMGRPSAIVIYL